MNKEPMKILLIKPGEYPEIKTIPHTLEKMQEQVGGMIEAVYPWKNRNACIVCNDDGKIMGLPLNRAIEEIDDAISGNFFICGLCETENGGDFCSLTEEQILEYEGQFHSPELFIHTPMGVLVGKCTPAQYKKVMSPNKKRPKKHDREER